MLEIAKQSLQSILDLIVAEPSLVLWLIAFVNVWLLVLRVLQSLKGQKMSTFNLKITEYFELGIKFERGDSKLPVKPDDKSKGKQKLGH